MIDPSDRENAVLDYGCTAERWTSFVRGWKNLGAAAFAWMAVPALRG
jgi:hypothetical protein